MNNIFMVILGLVGLYVGGRWLVKSSARLAGSFGISALVIGLTIVAWATSAPELVVNISAALQGSTEMALGNIIGSNIVNIGLALGLMALMHPVTIGWQLIIREIPIMILAALAATIMAMDGTISRLEGFVLFGGFLAFSLLIYIMVRRERRKITAVLDKYQEEEGLTDAKVNRLFEVGRMIAGVLFLIVGANFMVDGATALARSMGISELVIGMTLVAFGTSLPELSAAIVASMHHQGDIAVGNVVGSNIANILAILGVTALVQPISVAPAMLSFEIPVLLVFSALTLLFALDRIVRRWEAVALCTAYVGFILLSFSR
jgi:cation:H+ antiporter